jgi:hypothetical protein
MNRNKFGNNCEVLGTTRDEAEYIAVSTPLSLKKKEIPRIEAIQN